jgi:hypothetical protein
MISRRSSGSSRDASAVEPTRSQNSTLSWRRSADDTSATDRGDAASAAAVAARIVSAAPQSAQNFLPGGFSAPHAVQRDGGGVPQSPQNFFSSGLAAPQLGHFMSHLVGWIRKEIDLLGHQWNRAKRCADPAQMDERLDRLHAELAGTAR